MLIEMVLVLLMQGARTGPRGPKNPGVDPGSTPVNCGALSAQVCNHFANGIPINGKLVWPADVIPAIIDVDLETNEGIVVDSVKSGPNNEFHFDNVPVMNPDPVSAGELMTYFIVINTDGLDIVHQQLSLSTDNFTEAHVNVQLRHPPGVVSPNLETVTSFENIMSQTPKEAADAYDKAMGEARKGDSKKAIVDLQAALKMAPDYYDANLEMGLLDEKNHQFAEAEKYLNHALEMNPSSMKVRMTLGERAFAEKNYDKAANLLGQAVVLGGGSADVYLELGAASYETGDMDLAELSLIRALSINPSLGQANRVLYTVYLKEGKLDAALAQLQTYLARHPNAPDKDKVQGFADRIQKTLHP